MFDKTLLEKENLYREWIDKIPAVPFRKLPAEWDTFIRPPFSGVAARFLVKCGAAEVSVYLDLDQSAGGFWGEDGKEAPYWEAYPIPDADGYEDINRFALDDVNELVETIKMSMKYQLDRESLDA